MRTFKHFPKRDKCVICGTSKDGECILVGIDGTQEDNIEEGIPIHVDCISLRYNREVGAFYQKV